MSNLLGGLSANRYLSDKMIKLFFFFYVLIFFGCNSAESQITDTIFIEQLEKEWKHSREEETDSIQIYRPSNYMEFSPSRYRQVYAFADSGYCKYLALAPNDAHYFLDGTWVYNEELQTVSISDSLQQVIRSFKIITLTKKLLKLVQLQ